MRSPVTDKNDRSSRKLAREVLGSVASAARTLTVLATLVLGGLTIHVATASAATALNPTEDIPIGQLPSSCPQSPLATACEDAIVGYLDDARHDMGLAPYELPSSFLALSPDQQLLILSNLDRLAYGLSPVLGLNEALDASAAEGVRDDSDPWPPQQLAPGGAVLGWGSNWAGGSLNALMAYYVWMYDDGYGGPNGDCTSPAAPGCWGHRQNVLMSFGPASDGFISMGAAAGSYPGDPSYTMLIAYTREAPAYLYTWADALAEGANRVEAPSAVTGATSSLTQSSVTLNATVNPNGAKVGACFFEYGASESYGSIAECTELPGSGTTPVTVSASIVGLSANTSYHFRIVATNPGGTSYGIDQALTTPPSATPPSTTLESTTLGSTTPPSLTPPSATPVQPVVGGQQVSSGQGLQLAPDAKLASSTLTASASGAIAVEVTCPGGQSSCSGTVTLRTLTAVMAAADYRPKSHTAAILTLASGAFKVTGGTTTRVKLRLSAKARTLLARTHVLRVRATIVAHGPAGAKHTTLSILTIHAPKTTHRD